MYEFELDPYLVQPKQGKSSLSPQSPDTFLPCRGFMTKSVLGEFEERDIFRLEVVLSARRAVFFLSRFLLFLAGCREDSFARTLCLFQAEKRSQPFVAERKSDHCSGLVHCSGCLCSFPCRSLLRGRPRSLFALVPNPRNGAAGFCARRMMSD